MFLFFPAALCNFLENSLVCSNNSSSARILSNAFFRRSFIVLTSQFFLQEQTGSGQKSVNSIYLFSKEPADLRGCVSFVIVKVDHILYFCGRERTASKTSLVSEDWTAGWETKVSRETVRLRKKFFFRSLQA